MIFTIPKCILFILPTIIFNRSRRLIYRDIKNLKRALKLWSKQHIQQC